jgi:uncharacterized protein YukE
MREDPGGGSGFQVDPAELKGAAGQLGRAHDDMNVAITDYDGSVCTAPAAFGDFGMADAYSAFNSAWSAELSVTSEAIDELATKVTTTADNYQASDRENAQNIAKAGKS